jgi:hypothetical protein
VSKVIKSVLLTLKKSNSFQHSYCGSAKLALLGFAFVSACAVGQTPNVAMWLGIKLFFKMCGGKNF